MSRPINQVKLLLLFQAVAPDDAAWPTRVQATADQLYALLQHPDALTDGQWSALASLADRVTMSTFTGSTINRLIDAGNYAMAFYEFPKWVYGPDPVTGDPVVLPNLIARSNMEQAIFIS